LPSRQPQIRLSGDLRHKGIDHRGLADAGLTRDKPHLARTAPRLRQPFVKLGDLGFPPNGQGRQKRGGRPGTRGVREWRRGWQSPPPAIAAAGHRLEVLRGLRHIAQRLAHLVDRHGQDAVADRRLGPHRLHQLVFGKHPSRMRHQIAQQRKAFGPQMQWLVATPELLVLEVEPHWPGCRVVCLRHPSLHLKA